MQYKGTLIAVKDMIKSKMFYQTVLDLDVVMDAGANVELTGGVFLQTLDTWVNFIHKPKIEIMFSNNAIELYFETDDMDGFIQKLKVLTDIEYIHPLIEHSWGQRAIRFYDLDHHVIEVAENIVMVIKKFIDSGLSIEQTAIRMDVGLDYILSVLRK
ncbi:glyoxalase [Clostridia bacterium]|nr:glyoxalase [Clostridia bacterium]